MHSIHLLYCKSPALIVTMILNTATKQNEPVYRMLVFIVSVYSLGSDQPAHRNSLHRAFAARTIKKVQ